MKSEKNVTETNHCHFESAVFVKEFNILSNIFFKKIFPVLS